VTGLELIFPAAILLLIGQSLFAELVVVVILALLLFLFNFGILYVVGWIFSKIPKSWGVVLAIVLLAFGILLFFPGLDVIALLGLLFVYLGPKRRRK